MGDITELGSIVAGAFEHPDQAGNGEYLPLVGDFMSFNEIVETLNRQGHSFSFTRVPREVFATFFPMAPEIAATFSLVRGAYLPGFGFVRPDRARQHSSGPADRPSLRRGPE